MTCRCALFVFALAIFIGDFALVDQGTADAQGPLRRLGDRIRARVEPLVQPPASPAVSPTAPPRASSGLRPVAPYSPSTTATPSKPLAEPSSRDSSRDSEQMQQTLPSSPRAREPMLARPSTQGAANSQVTPSIGIDAEEFRNGFGGVRIMSFRSNSKADSAGLRVGDVIVGINGREASTIADVSQALSSMEPGDLVQLRVVRKEDLVDSTAITGRRQIPTHFVSVPLVDRLLPTDQIAQANSSNANQQVTYNQQTSDASLGAELSSASGRQGALVTSVIPRSPAEAAKLQAGDRIVSINGRMVQGASGVSQMLARSNPGDRLRVQWVRGDQLREASIVLAGRDGISPDSVARGTSMPANKTESPAGPASGSLFNGIGSAVGNWFGGSNKSTTKPTTQDSLTELAGPSVLMQSNEEIGRTQGSKPLASPSNAAGKPSDSVTGPVSEELPMPSAARDPLEFGDEELVPPVGSGESNKSLKPVVTPLDETTDPPSLDNLLPPVKKSADSTSKDEKTISLLLSEIEQLRSRLEELEKSKLEKSKTP